MSFDAEQGGKRKHSLSYGEHFQRRSASKIAESTRQY